MTTLPAGIRAVFFDAGLTLIYGKASLSDLCVRAAEQCGITLAHEAVEVALPGAAAQLHHAHRKDTDLWASDAKVHRLWHEYYLYIFHQLGLAEQAEQCAKAVYASYSEPGAWCLFDDALPTLRALHERGYIVGVISDWASNLTSGILLPLGVGRYIDFIIVSTVQREGKPGWGLYREALARAGVSPAEAVHIGDNYVNDVLGARSAGIYGIYLDRDDRHTAPLDCLRLTTIQDIIPLLDETTKRKDGGS
ncbi:MAG: HAD family hydrolase [Chloroflexota bacterium]